MQEENDKIAISLTVKHLKILGELGVANEVNYRRYIWDDNVGMVLNPPQKLIDFYGTVEDDPQFKELLIMGIIRKADSNNHQGRYLLMAASSWGTPAIETREEFNIE